MEPKSNRIEQSLRRQDKMKVAFEAGEYNIVVELVESPSDYFTSSEAVFLMIRTNKLINQILTAALTGFANAELVNGEECVGWLHQLAHFDTWLWQQGLLEWLRLLYTRALNEADHAIRHRPFDSLSLLYRLLHHYHKYSKWNDDPICYGLTEENLKRLKSQDTDFFNRMDNVLTTIKMRIEQGSFKSEADFLRWQFEHPTTIFDFDWRRECSQIMIGNVRGSILRIAQNGENVIEFLEHEEKLLKQQLSRLERELIIQQELTDYSEIKTSGLQSCINELKWVLGCNR